MFIDSLLAGNTTTTQLQEKLDKLGFLARLQEYEPVDFWSSKA